MASKRLNITIEEGMYQLIEDAARELYGGNVSRYLADAGLYYAGVLRGQKKPERLDNKSEKR
ncbi:MAG: hypothetical protein GX956_06430, partial [Firmicutes bacterium]|nr:hypothetical protein [Bacillota bacterium]